MCLLDKCSDKALYAAFCLVRGSSDDIIAEFRRIWETAKVLLPHEAVTYTIANNLGADLYDQGKY